MVNIKNKSHTGEQRALSSHCWRAKTRGGACWIRTSGPLARPRLSKPLPWTTRPMRLKKGWCPRGESNSQNSASKADTFANFVTGAHFGCVLARHHRRRCTKTASSCTSRLAACAVDPSLCCKGTPEVRHVGHLPQLAPSGFRTRCVHQRAATSQCANWQLAGGHPGRDHPGEKQTDKKKGPEPCGVRALASRGCAVEAHVNTTPPARTGVHDCAMGANSAHPAGMPNPPVHRAHTPPRWSGTRAGWA